MIGMPVGLGTVMSKCYVSVLIIATSAMKLINAIIYVISTNYKSLGLVMYVCMSWMDSKTTNSIGLVGWSLIFNFSRMVLEKKIAKKIQKGPVMKLFQI